MIFGWRLFGKVHKFDNNVYIATQFFHLCFFPIAPMSSYIVLSNDGNQFQGIKIPFYWFSLVIAYLRAFSIAGALSLPFGLVINEGPNFLPLEYTNNTILLWAWSVFSVFCLALSILLYVHPRVRNASKEIEQLVHSRYLSTPSA